MLMVGRDASHNRKKIAKLFRPLPTIYILMIVVKVSDKLQYNVGKLQKGIKVSKNIPNVLITAKEG